MKRGATNLSAWKLVDLEAALVRRVRRLRLRVKVHHRLSIGARRLDVAIEEKNSA